MRYKGLIDKYRHIFSRFFEEVKEMKVQMERNNAESETYRQKIHKLVSENTNLSDEVRDAQENLRLSASQMGKLQNELKVLCNENDFFR